MMTNKQKLAIEKAKKELTSLQVVKDIEGNHANADDILCTLLKELGAKEVVDIYNTIEKWYA